MMLRSSSEVAEQGMDEAQRCATQEQDNEAETRTEQANLYTEAKLDLQSRER